MKLPHHGYRYGYIAIFCQFSPAESGLDLYFRYIENVLIDYDRQHLQTSESDGCHPGTLEQLAEFKMASKRVAIYKELAIIGPYYKKN